MMMRAGFAQCLHHAQRWRCLMCCRLLFRTALDRRLRERATSFFFQNLYYKKQGIVMTRQMKMSSRAVAAFYISLSNIDSTRLKITCITRSKMHSLVRYISDRSSSTRLNIFVPREHAASCRVHLPSHIHTCTSNKCSLF